MNGFGPETGESIRLQSKHQPAARGGAYNGPMPNTPQPSSAWSMLYAHEPAHVTVMFCLALSCDENFSPVVVQSIDSARLLDTGVPVGAATGAVVATGAAVSGAAETGATVTGAAVTGAAVSGAAVTGAAVTVRLHVPIFKPSAA